MSRPSRKNLSDRLLGVDEVLKSCPKVPSIARRILRGVREELEAGQDESPRTTAAATPPNTAARAADAVKTLAAVQATLPDAQSKQLQQAIDLLVELSGPGTTGQQESTSVGWLNSLSRRAKASETPRVRLR